MPQSYTHRSVWLNSGRVPGRNEHDVLTNLFRALTCVPIEEQTGHLAGAYLRQYRRSHSVEVADALIAASAVASGAELWTGNNKHFPMKEISFFD
jgi:predicted nucleic acid-binding protein